MYLARETIGGKHRYIVRESYARGKTMCSRDLFHLGDDPGRFIVYPGGRAYYIDEVVEDRLRALGVTCEPGEIDDLFLPFLDPEIRWKLEWIADRGRGRSAHSRQREITGKNVSHHLFDKRRIHFLRTGSMHQGHIGRMPSKLLNVLNGKSRDEIEQYFMRLETALHPGELKTYAFVVFDVQRFFSSAVATTAPERLTAEAVDDHFVEQICRLDRDESFWSGMNREKALHAYLARYVVIYFDHDWGRRHAPNDYFKSFINRRRQYRAPGKVVVRMAEAAAIFDTCADHLKQMSRDDLVRLFRRRAQKLHPDKGGDHDRFVHLVEAYHSLLRGKHKQQL